MRATMTSSSIDSGGVRARIATCLTFLALALLQPALVHAQAAATANPRLASLGIEIWPEYDRPAALVILRGTLAEDVKASGRRHAAAARDLRRRGGGGVLDDGGRQPAQPEARARDHRRVRDGEVRDADAVLPRRVLRADRDDERRAQLSLCVAGRSGGRRASCWSCRSRRRRPTLRWSRISIARRPARRVCGTGPANWARVRRASRCRSRCATRRRTRVRRPRS